YHSNFPSYIQISNKEQIGSRLAWCYGDLGIGMALYITARHLNNTDIERKSIDILGSTISRRTQDITGVVDACFCHGTCGIGHIYNRLYNYTNISMFKDASIYWFNKT